MAKNPYTQDITPTVEAVRKANTPSYASQLIDVFQTYAKNHESRAKENIDNLQTDFVFEKQALNARISNYNKIMAIQAKIRDEYGGNTEAYASFIVNKNYKNRVGTHYNMLGQEGWRIIDDYTDVVSRDYLKSRTKNYTDKLNKMFKTASNINLTETVDETYIDDLFSSEINKLPDTVRGGGWGLLGNLIAGQGLKVGQEYSVTREDILKRVYSDIPNKELGELSDAFKSLNIDNKELRDQLVNEILPNKKVGYDFKIVDTGPKEQEFMGQKIRYIESYMTYIDHNGRQQHTKPVRRNLNEGELFFDADSMLKFRKTYNDKGLKIWKEEHDKGTPLSEIVKILNSDMDNLKNPYEDDIKKTWTTPTPALLAIYESFLVSNGFAEVGAFGQSQINMKEGASEMQGYMSYDQFIKDSMNKQLNILGIETVGVYGNSIPVLSTGKIPLAYTLSKDSLDNTTWQDSWRGTNPVITNDNGVKIPLIEELLQSLELDTGPKLADLQQEFKNNDFTNVNSLGLFWNQENPYILKPEELIEIGIDSTEPIQFGYNIKDDEFVMRSTTAARNEPEEEKKVEVITETKDIVEKMNDVPYAGAVSEVLLGEDLSVGDAVWLIPGTLAVKSIGKTTMKVSLNIAARTIFSMPSTKKTVAEMVKRHGTGKFKMGFNTEKAYLKWFNALGPVEKTVVNSLSKSGKSIEYGVFYKNFVKIQGLRVMAYVPTAGKIMKWSAIGGTVAAGQYYDRSSRSIEDRAYNLDHPRGGQRQTTP